VKRWLLTILAAVVFVPSGCYISNYPEYEPSKPKYLGEVWYRDTGPELDYNEIRKERREATQESDFTLPQR
jgi:hypothetical protein